jgi:hypothetical protein
VTTIVIAILSILIAIPAGLALWFLISLAWIAKGSHDVNGDPERDGGAE